MKKKSFMLAAAALAGMVLLSACSAPQMTDNAGGNDSSTAGAQSAGQDAGSINTSENPSGQDSGSTGMDAGAADVNTDEGTAGADAGSAAWPESSDGDGMQEQDGMDDIQEIDPNAGAADSQSGADSDTSSQDSWSGTYASESETLSITYLDEQSLSFAFGQAGISGTAQLSGTQAVYKGDDHHDVVFDISGDTITVSVSSEEDYDASESPLNGTYVKEG